MAQRRTGARMLLFDDLDRLLLIEERWAGSDGPWQHWITPGGGVEPGEQLAAAAVREVYEETSLRVELPADAPEVHTHSRAWSWAGVDYDQDDHFFAARLGAPAQIRPAAPTEIERLTVVGARWWTPAELRATGDVLVPAELADVVADVLRGRFGQLRRPLFRRAGRALLLDPAGRTLLIRTRAANGQTNWVTPGGGVEAGESTAAAAVRELGEETGLDLPPPTEGPVHVERAVFAVDDYLLDQVDDYYLVPIGADLAGPVIDRSRLTDYELSTVVEYRWLGAEDVRRLAATQRVWPYGLADLIDRLTAGR
jgi:8-oxo-dGTP pyrophosphatase MutT (NUDIX family)